MKFIVIKGIEGFGDRLQCLLQAIGYAKTTGRILVVDWRDSHWTHDQKLGFDHYFQIIGVKSLSLYDFKCELERHAPINCDFRDVIPQAWSKHLFDPDYENYIRDPSFALPGNGSILQNIALGEVADFEQLVVVYPGIGPRTYQFSDINHIKPQKAICDKLQKCVNHYQLTSSQYDVVHLRGGTKTFAGGTISSKNPDYGKHIQWSTAQHYLKEIYDVLSMLRQGSVDYPIYILTDTPCLADLWITLYGQATLIDNCVHGLMGMTGIHKISKSELACASHPGDTGVKTAKTKEFLNTEAIRDFIIMNNARFLVGDGVSIFSLLAYGLKINNVALARLPLPQGALQAGNQKIFDRTRWQF